MRHADPHNVFVHASLNKADRVYPTPCFHNPCTAVQRTRGLSGEVSGATSNLLPRSVQTEGKRSSPAAGRQQCWCTSRPVTYVRARSRGDQPLDTVLSCATRLSLATPQRHSSGKADSSAAVQLQLRRADLKCTACNVELSNGAPGGTLCLCKW